jgi:acetylcholinesterase
VYKRGKALPVLGTFHSTDLVNSFGGGELQDYFITFARKYDPNRKLKHPDVIPARTKFNWPTWTEKGKVIVALLDGNVTLALERDDYRKEGIAYINELSKELS